MRANVTEKRSGIFRKIGAALMTGLLLASVALVGCSSGDEDTEQHYDYVENPDALPLEVTDSGCSLSADNKINFAFIVTNPNTEYVARDVKLSVEGFDSQGQMVFGDIELVGAVYPFVETAISGTTTALSGATGVDNVVVTPAMESVKWTKMEATESQMSSMFSVSNMGNVRNQSNLVTVNGWVTVGDVDALAKVEGVRSEDVSANVTVVLVDEDGNILAGGSAYGLIFDGMYTNYESDGQGADGEDGQDASSDSQASNQASGDETAGMFTIEIADAPTFSQGRVYVWPVS